MPRKKISATKLPDNSAFIDIHSILNRNHGSHVLWGTMNLDDEIKYLNSSFSDRTDYARTIDIRIPQGYHAQVKKTWEMYGTDRLFRYLIDRAIDFGANGFEWEIPIENIDNQNEEEVKNTIKQIDKEKKIWDKWAATLNFNVANVLPGTDEINKWLIKHLLLGGMAPLEWEWGTITVDDVEYQFPVRMTLYNTLSVILKREVNKFESEEVWVRLNSSSTNTEADTSKQVTAYASPMKGSNNWRQINVIRNGMKYKHEGFVIKYNWSPGDNTTLFSGKTPTVGEGLYPSAPFVGLFEILMLRRALVASDLAILDGIINYVIDWEIGDNTVVNGMMPNQPRPAKKDANGTVLEKSTIELIKEMITQDTRANVMQLFHPYYVKLKILTPDVTSLVSSEKYIQSLVEMFLAFGILLSPSDRRIDFTTVDVTNFEQMLENIRLNHIRRFWESLCGEIVKRNKDKLKNIPNMIFNPLATQSERFRKELLSITELGKLSSESLLQAFKKDKKVELGRIIKEISSGEKSLMDKNVPISYKQQAVKKTGEVIEDDRPATRKGGRPPQKGIKKEVNDGE